MILGSHPEIEAILPPNRYSVRDLPITVTRVYCGGVKINSCCMKLHFVSLYDPCMMHDLFFSVKLPYPQFLLLPHNFLVKKLLLLELIESQTYITIEMTVFSIIFTNKSQYTYTSSIVPG